MILLNYLEENITQLYRSINLINSEQLNPEYIALKLNIYLYYWDEPSQAIFIHNRPHIFLNRLLSTQNQWEEFYHELAHILLHIGDQMNMPKLLIEYQEYKANNFSLHAAIPTSMLLQMDLPNNFYRAVAIIQKEFKVSTEFACKRLAHFLVNNPSYVSQKAMSVV